MSSVIGWDKKKQKTKQKRKEKHTAIILFRMTVQIWQMLLTESPLITAEWQMERAKHVFHRAWWRRKRGRWKLERAPRMLPNKSRRKNSEFIISKTRSYRIMARNDSECRVVKLLIILSKELKKKSALCLISCKHLRCHFVTHYGVNFSKRHRYCF